jgi:hypothetical protein
MTEMTGRVDLPTCGKSRGKLSAPSGLNSVPTRSASSRRGSCCLASEETISCTDESMSASRELVSVPPLSSLRETFARDEAFWAELLSSRPSAP